MEFLRNERISDEWAKSYAFIAPMYVLFSKNCRRKDAAVERKSQGGEKKKKISRKLQNFRKIFEYSKNMYNSAISSQKMK